MQIYIVIPTFNPLFKTLTEKNIVPANLLCLCISFSLLFHHVNYYILKPRNVMCNRSLSKHVSIGDQGISKLSTISPNLSYSYYMITN